MSLFKSKSRHIISNSEFILFFIINSNLLPVFQISKYPSTKAYYFIFIISFIIVQNFSHIQFLLHLTRFTILNSRKLLFFFLGSETIIVRNFQSFSMVFKNMWLNQCTGMKFLRFLIRTHVTIHRISTETDFSAINEGAIFKRVLDISNVVFERPSLKTQIGSY